MRFKKPLAGAVAAALAGVLVMAGVAQGGGEPSITQSMDAKIAPKKLPKKKYKPAKITVDVATVNDADPDHSDCATPPPSNCPSKTSKATIKFTKDLKFAQKSVKACNANLQGTTTAQARAACKKSIVGRGGATIIVPGAGALNPYAAVVTAFDGPAKKLFLHAYQSDLANTTVLTGTLRKASGKAFGKQLVVPVDPLPAGAIIVQFDTAVKRGKYVQARCRSKKWKFSSDWQYHDHSPITGVNDRQKCKIKR